MSSKILTCSCKHPYQDAKYGENRRVMNAINKGYRCTVCGKDKLP